MNNFHNFYTQLTNETKSGQIRNLSRLLMMTPQEILQFESASAKWIMWGIEAIIEDKQVNKNASVVLSGI